MTMTQPVQADAPTSPPDQQQVTTADLRRAAWASSIGSALEYYDFALYSLASALIFSPLFFPSADPTTGLILSFSVGMNIAQTALNVVLGFGAIFIVLRTLRWHRLVTAEQQSRAEAP